MSDPETLTPPTSTLTPEQEAIAMDGPLPETLEADWTKFLAEDQAPPGCDAYLEVFAHPVLFPLQRRRELAEMMRLCRLREPRIVAEIGADKGGGIYHWCKSLPSVEVVVACEIRGTPYAESFQRAFPEIEFLWLPRSSRDPEALARLRSFLRGRRIDCCFFDGDKARFVEDFDSWLPYLAPSGLALMHDVQDRSPKEAFETVAARGYTCSVVLDRSEGEEVAERESRGEPCLTCHEGWLRHWKGRSCGVGVIELAGD